jgi:hypothetical protein
MNEHETTRIAAAFNQLRPDWPAKQIKTLLGHASLVDRPRRDVCVALAWIACESASATPYRVLESGPWWRAAAVEGDTAPRNVEARHRCGICGQREDHAMHATDHPFERLGTTCGDTSAGVKLARSQMEDR